MLMPWLLLRAQEGHPSVADLPSHLHAEEGKVSLIADFEARDEAGQIPVYVINQSGESLNLNSQDGDFYVKLEVEEDRRWVRAQPHAFSWCGNSYHRGELKPGHFIKVVGYQSLVGDRKPIRYAFYRQDIELVSNVGEGRVAKHDVDLASRDALAVLEGDFEFVSKVALGDLKLRNEMDRIDDLQQVAIEQLGSRRFDRDACRKVLRQVIIRFPERADEINRSLTRLDNDDVESTR